MIPLTPLTSGALTALVLFLVITKYVRLRLPLPPGPPGYPIIGNLLDKSGPFDWTKWDETRARWGDITSFSTLRSTTVTLHTYEKAVEILDKKSRIFSSRPPFPMFALGGWDNHVSMLPYGSQLHSCRKMIRSEMNRVKLGHHDGDREMIARRFLRVLRKSPEQFYKLIEWYGTTITMKVAYGYNTIYEEDPMLQLLNDSFSGPLHEGAKPGYAIEVIPWLRYVPSWLPFAGFKKAALKWRKDYANIRQVFFEYGANETGHADNFVSTWLKRIDTESEKDMLYLKECALILIAASFETSAIAMRAFFFLMSTQPEAQKLAQEELDAVIGRDRLPTFEDRAKLPYLNALCKEVLRHNPPLLAGIPHMSTADDVHDGYFIPKGTMVIASIWEMSRDPVVYKDPETFNPSRFLGPQPERDPALFIFGFGRRKCSGSQFAEGTLFITAATILAAFDIGSSRNGTAKLERAQNVTSQAGPFDCTITPREGVNLDGLTRDVAFN